METCEGLERFTPPQSGVVLTIGNFDGLHRGHAAMVRRAREVARARGAPVVVVTLDPHPLAILTPDRAPPQLTTLRERLLLLERAGVDAVILLRATKELLATRAEQFVDLLVQRCRPRAFVEGPTFNFGRDRGGSVRTLHELAPRYGFAVHVIDELRCEALPDCPPINSSTIRRALQEGHIEAANAMLGRPHRITGVVVRGAGRGNAFGFPTVNLDQVPQLVPRQAVYAAIAQLADGTLHLAAVNIGPQPTFGQQAGRVEAHLLDFRGELLGQRVGLHLLAALRGQTKFHAVEALAAQLERDVAQTRQYAPAIGSLAPLPLE